MWDMSLILSRQQRQQLLDWAVQAGNHECCGLLYGDNGKVEKVEWAINVAQDTGKNFEIDPATIIAAEKQARAYGANVLGYFHSHPNGLAAPSETDKAMAAVNGRIWAIIANGAVSAWSPVADNRGQVSFARVAIVVEG